MLNKKNTVSEQLSPRSKLFFFSPLPLDFSPHLLLFLLSEHVLFRSLWQQPASVFSLRSNQVLPDTVHHVSGLERCGTVVAVVPEVAARQGAWAAVL